MVLIPSVKKRRYIYPEFSKMTNSVAEYYLNELYDWKSAIELYLEEIEDSEEWLQSILRYDSVPALPAKVEHCLNQLFLSRNKFLKIRSAIQSAERKLYKEQMPVDNNILTKETRQAHKRLRGEMHETEKEYLDVKYDCNEFLENAVEIQGRIKSNN